MSYETGLEKVVAEADRDTLKICKAWHGETFGQPGYGSTAWVTSELEKAKKARDVICTLYICVG